MTNAALSRPFWLPVHDRQDGRLAALLHEPAPPAARLRGLVLHVPPFGEELNKSRRMTTATARALAQAGHAVLQLDLAGCGDSPGDWSTASWKQWREDVLAGARWLRSVHPAVAPLWLWGLRAGALIAAEALQELDDDTHLLLWQPATQGRAVLQQFLRLKSLGEAAEGGARSTTAELRRQIDDGLALKIAGYTLSAELAAGLDASRLAPPDVPRTGSRHLVLLECQPSRDQEGAPGTVSPSPATQQAAAAWRTAGWSVLTRVAHGPAFWQTVEMEAAPELIDTTVAQLLQVDLPAAPLQHVAAASLPPDVDASEQWVCVDLGREQLAGVLHLPQVGIASDWAVLIIVGGPQTRLGSHRQFVQLARQLASEGHAVMRFDVRGMGDSTGEPRPFDALSDDVQAAIDALWARRAGLSGVVLWGLCDGASAAAIHAGERADPRVTGLCLVNPWVRTAQSLAQAHVRHYYLHRLKTRDVWTKLLRGGVGLRALKGLIANLGLAWQGRAAEHSGPTTFQDRMLVGLKRHAGQVQVLLSEHDHTAQEFTAYVQARAEWQRWLAQPSVIVQTVADADHTFSRPGAADRVAELTAHWLRQCRLAKVAA